MLTPDLLHDYQKKAVNFQCSRQHSMLWLDMGLGKTVITLTSLSHLLKTRFLNGVLIVAPIRVIRLVWRQEAAKWQHTQHLKFSMITGNRDQRTRALMRPADIYMINYENMKWLAEVLQTYFVSKGRKLPFNGVVWDEISKMKNSTTNRVHAWFNGKRNENVLDHFVWRTGLTGTPASNGYKDLHGQYLVVDSGQRLGKFKTAFMTQWYMKDANARKDIPYRDTEDGIKKLISDITLEMSAEDYNPLPDLIVNDVEIEMPDNLRAKYEQFEQEFLLTLDSGKEIEVFNKAALTNKCLQFANGSVYPVAGLPLWESVHDLKLQALEDILDEAQGSPVLCSYAFRSDAERIMERFKHLSPINLTACKSEASLNNAMDRWKAGDCPLMIGHAACLSADTQVLTERNGWVKITEVGLDDKVFDGVEYVSHDGCQFSGVKDVIDVFGITMTPDHKLLIGDEWVTADDVRDRGITRDEAAFKWEKVANGFGSMSRVQNAKGNVEAECFASQQEKPKLLDLLEKHESWFDRDTDLENLARFKGEVERPVRSQLRRSWNNCVRQMAILREFLRGHVGDILGRLDHRTHRREWSVLQGELQMGYQHGATVEQAQQPCCRVPRQESSSGRTRKTFGVQQDDVGHATQSWNDRRRGCRGLQELTLRKKSGAEEQNPQRSEKVYDLVNCGPRHRFLIRNSQGDVFISHNSMGHGVDGLQKNGHILVWFGLNWSLDLYEQFNARVRRQGQGVPVICHRILMQKTLDYAQALALDEKATTQTGLRNAVKQYRQMKGV